jgi:DnaJ-class molecular chaperone
MAPKVKTVEVGCPTCGASGHFGDESRAQDNPFCPQCKGRGKISVPLDQAQPCPDCKGRGHVENVPCVPCAHTGKIISAPATKPGPSHESLTAENAALKEQLAALQAKKHSGNTKA